MLSDWSKCKHILCIRPDNLGDLLMSTPAIRALKETFQCKITLLTSSVASHLVSMIPEIDELMVFDLPWVKHNGSFSQDQFNALIQEIKEKQFDACVLFTVYSQNPLPTVMLAYMAGVPRRLAYCRENPYALLTDWVPDQEPYSFIQHQVRRDLNLVAFVGATTKSKRLSLEVPLDAKREVGQLLVDKGVNPNKPWLILHTGVSEEKRKYPDEHWIQTGKLIVEELEYQILLTGSVSEKEHTEHLAKTIGRGAYSLAGHLVLSQFVQLIKNAPLVVSVNTATVHISAAVETTIVVLYALTNPQHLPWKGKGKLLFFDVPNALQSKNEVIQYVRNHLHPVISAMPSPRDIVEAVRELLFDKTDLRIPEMVPLRKPADQAF